MIGKYHVGKIHVQSINKDTKTMPRHVVFLYLTWNMYFFMEEQHRCCALTANIERIQLFHVMFLSLTL